MALILCIETATTMCSVALGSDGKLLALKEQNAGYTHAENLSIFISEVMKEAGMEFSRLDAVAVSEGPGSYTGLRIGVSSAKGICYALDKPLISVNTLYSMFLFARELQTPGSASRTLFCPMLDARRMEVYCVVYDERGKEIRPVSAEIITQNSFADLLGGHRIIFFGDGAAKCKALLDYHEHAVFIDDIFPSAASMVALAEEKFREKNFENIAYFEPFYLKDFMTGVKKQKEAE